MIPAGTTSDLLLLALQSTPARALLTPVMFKKISAGLDMCISIIVESEQDRATR